MNNNNLPLWTVFAAMTLLSPFFLLIKDYGIPAYTINYLAIFNLAIWVCCALVYGGEYLYKKWQI